MVQGYLPGHAQLEVVECDGRYHVNYGFYEFASFAKEDKAALRVTIVQLVKLKVRIIDLRRCFGVSRNSIYQWLAAYEKGGLEAVVALRPGAEVKVTDDIKAYIVSRYAALASDRRRNHNQIISGEVQRLFDIKVSRETIRKAVNEARLNAKKKWRQVEEERPPDVPEAGAGTETGTTCSEPSGASSEPAEGAQHVAHGGALLALPLLAAYEAEKMVPEQAANGSNGYSFLECFFALLLPLLAGILTVEENIKRHDSPAMGGLIGRSRLPSLRVIRRKIALMVEAIQEQLPRLKLDFARRCLALGAAGDTFYIDGHVMPYTGQEKLFKVYNTSRRLVEKGRCAYVVNTPAGRPIYEVLSGNFDHFHDNVLRLCDVLREELEIARPTIVMDRAAFGEEFFAAVEEKADFISWYKGKQTPGKNASWQEVKAPVQSNTWGEAKYQSIQCTEKVIAEGGEDGIGCRRLFFVKRGEKISLAITCKKEAALEELVLSLTRRWGAQENPFKELKKDGYDSLHSYEKAEYSEQYLAGESLDPDRMMDNPEYKKLREEKRKLQAQHERILGRNAAKDENPSKQQREKLEQLETQIADLQERMNSLNKRISRMGYINTAGIVRLKDDKKKYFNLMNFLVHNTRRDIAEIIGPIYQNNRDIHQIVLKFLNTTATVKQGTEHTTITLPPPSKKNERVALQHLCATLTDMAETSTLFTGKLVYNVQ